MNGRSNRRGGGHAGDGDQPDRDGNRKSETHDRATFRLLGRRSYRRTLTALAIAAACVAFALPAVSATQGKNATGSTGASVTVSAVCTLTSGSLNFGSYDPVVANLSAALSVTGSFSIACTKGAAPVLSLNNGNNSAHAPSGVTRAMINGSSYLGYELYTTSARSTVWNTTNTVTYTSTTKATSTEYVYGTIPANQNVPAGSYADTVTVTSSL